MNISPKEQAQRLVNIFYISLPNNGSFTGLNNINKRWEEGKKCALIHVNEVINNVLEGIDLVATWGDYWNKVKEEIEKL